MPNKPTYEIRLRTADDYLNGLPEVTDIVSPSRPIIEGNAARIHDLTGSAVYRFVAVDGEQVIGTATLVTHAKLLHNGSKAGQIEDVAVLPEYQHKGVGSKLLEACKQQAKDAGCYKVQLQCDSENIVAEFYRANGFCGTRYLTMRWDCG